MKFNVFVQSVLDCKTCDWCSGFMNVKSKFCVKCSLPLSIEFNECYHCPNKPMDNCPWCNECRHFDFCKRDYEREISKLKEDIKKLGDLCH